MNTRTILDADLAKEVAHLAPSDFHLLADVFARWSQQLRAAAKVVASEAQSKKRRALQRRKRMRQQLN
jgi:hypothetical protein